MMKDGQFKQFAAEVLQQGTDAVLPQNLPDRWLNALLEEAEIFQEEDSDIEETRRPLKRRDPDSLSA